MSLPPPHHPPEGRRSPPAPGQAQSPFAGGSLKTQAKQADSSRMSSSGLSDGTAAIFLLVGVPIAALGLAFMFNVRGVGTRYADGPISSALYVLGMPGLTAYFGLLEICRPQAGETVVVSGAAGAVGSLVGQIARIKRCRAIGISGGAGKVRFLIKELGFDGAFNYRETPDYAAKLQELCPNGVDVYFDNVGGAITDAVMRRIAKHARVAVCGQISQYNAVEPQTGPRWLSQLVVRQAKVEGFLVSQFAGRFEAGLKQLSTWLKEKRLLYREDVVNGLENAPKAFIRMLEGKNIGKQLVKVSE